MIDLHIPTTDGRELLLTRYNRTRNPKLALLLDKLKFVLPAQPKPKNQRRSDRPAIPRVVKTFEGPLERSQSLSLCNLPQSAKIG